MNVEAEETSNKKVKHAGPRDLVLLLPPQPKDPGIAVETEETTPLIEEKAVFDKEILMERVAGDEDFGKEILGLFVEDTAGQIEILAQAMKDGDPVTVERHAHTIKGASANVGASRLADITSEMEKMGKGSDIDLARGLMEALNREFETLKNILKQCM